MTEGLTREAVLKHIEKIANKNQWRVAKVIDEVVNFNLPQELSQIDDEKLLKILNNILKEV